MNMYGSLSIPQLMLRAGEGVTSVCSLVCDAIIKASSTHAFSCCNYMSPCHSVTQNWKGNQPCVEWAVKSWEPG